MFVLNATLVYTYFGLLFFQEIHEQRYWINDIEKEGVSFMILLSLILGLIILQIRNKYFKYFLIKRAPQAVWRHAGLAMGKREQLQKCTL